MTFPFRTIIATRSSSFAFVSFSADTPQSNPMVIVVAVTKGLNSNVEFVNCHRRTSIQPHLATEVCLGTLPPQHCMCTFVAILGFTPRATTEETLITKASIDGSHELADIS